MKDETKEGFVKIKMPKYYIAKHSDEDLQAAVLAEREACAKLCDKQAQNMLELIGLPVVTSAIIQRDRAAQWSKCAAAIRARSKND